jgi:hypothetical protein
MPRPPSRLSLSLALGFLLGLCACGRAPATDTSVPAVADDAAEHGAASPALPAASAPGVSIYSVVPPNARL